MATPVSSLIGANLEASGSTELFALGTICEADQGQRYEYVVCSGTFTTGQLVTLTPTGTALMLLTARVSGQNDFGLDLAAVQRTISQGEFGWVAKQGRNLYVKCSGTVTAGGEIGYGIGVSGKLVNALWVGVGNTALGVFVTTSASIVTESVAVATLTWPRIVTE